MNFIELYDWIEERTSHYMAQSHSAGSARQKAWDDFHQALDGVDAQLYH